MPSTSNTVPFLGYGLGLRTAHYEHIFAHKPAVDWFEIISENFMDTGGMPRINLERIRADYPIVMHGVSLSIGTVDPLNSHYLRQLRALIHEIEPRWVSDHLCWTGVAHKTTHDLLPVPYTQEALDHIVSRIHQVQDYLGRPIALENPSTYLEFTDSSMPEAEFIAAMAKRTGCHLLLDVNNVHVTCFNHRLQAKAYIDSLPLEQVIQVHLAGHTHMGTHIVDTHDRSVADEVWDLYRYVLARAEKPLNTMIEWDDAIPPFEVVYDELMKAKAIGALEHSISPASEQVMEISPRGLRHARPPSLSLIQKRLQDAIIDAEPSSVRWIKPKDDFCALSQLAVYRTAYRARLIDGVAEDFPVLGAMLGQDVLHEMIERYVEATPATHYNIARYSSRFPAWVERHLPDHRLALNIAQLEQGLVEISYAAESRELRPEDIASLTPDVLMETMLRPRTALRLFHFSYPVNAYYERVINGDSHERPAPQASYLVVFRHEGVVWRMPLEATEFAILDCLFMGKTIGEALAEIEANSNLGIEELSQKLTQWFSRWMQHGLLAAPPKASVVSVYSAAAFG